MFFTCYEVSKIFQWLSTMYKSLSWRSLLKGCTGRWSKLAHQVMIYAIKHIIWRIRIQRHKWNFQYKIDYIPIMINIAEVKFSYSLASDASKPSITYFKIALLFHIPLRGSKLVTTSEVWRLSPQAGWVKANIDGSTFASPSCGSIKVVSSDNDSY